MMHIIPYLYTFVATQDKLATIFSLGLLKRFQQKAERKEVRDVCLIEVLPNLGLPDPLTALDFNVHVAKTEEFSGIINGDFHSW